jgi:hypothetical protein
MQVLDTLLYNTITTMVMVEGRNNSLIMVFKTALTQAMTLGLVSDTSIANIDLQVVTMGQL